MANNLVQTSFPIVQNQGSLPDFIIIGAQKGGTTALRFNLQKHPDIFTAKVECENLKRPFKREINFFDDDENWVKGISWYKNLFSESNKIQGEKTPSYFQNKKALRRIAEVAPHTKLIIMLRNPIDRAYSQWNHHNQKLKQSLDKGWRKDTFENIISLAIKNNFPFSTLISQGKYILHIQYLLKYFPEEQLFFGISERFIADPNGQLNKVLDFLGVERMHLKPRIRHKREYPEPMKQEIKVYLEKLFKPYNQQLFDFLGEEIVEWEHNQ